MQNLCLLYELLKVQSCMKDVCSKHKATMFSLSVCTQLTDAEVDGFLALHICLSPP